MNKVRAAFVAHRAAMRISKLNLYGFKSFPDRTVKTDTMGPLPLSALKNRYMQSWYIVGSPEYIVVTFAPDKSAASSWTGFEEFCRERGVTVMRDSIAQSISLEHDNGSEYLGVFLQNCVRAGFVQRSSTAHKKRKMGAQSNSLLVL